MCVRNCIPKLIVLAFVTLGFAHPASAQPDPPPPNQWLGGAGDWHDSTKWSQGVPSSERSAIIVDGEAVFDSEARVNGLAIGLSRPGNELGVVTGTADLVIHGDAVIGQSGGTGMGRTEVGRGHISLSGGDLQILGGQYESELPAGIFGFGRISVGTGAGTGTGTSFTGIGEVHVVDGNVSVPLGISVGSAAGTGSGKRGGQGTVNVFGGNLTTQSLSIGSSGGTGDADATANGEVNVVGGGVILQDSPLDELEPDRIYWEPNPPKTGISIGNAHGTGRFRGKATGTLRVTDGDIVADVITLGKTSFISSSNGSAHGSLYLRNGNVQMRELSIGMPYTSRGSGTGLFEQLGGITTGNWLYVASSSMIVLGIGGPTPGQDYSQLLVDNVAIDGVLEARFMNGFVPSPGDRFDLVVADTLWSGFNSLRITGLSGEAWSSMSIVRNEHRIRLVFAVPEPGAVILTVIGFVLLNTARR